MTLNDWCKKHGEPIFVEPSVHVYCEIATQPYLDLFDLSDYRLSSRSGPVCWMVPRVKYRAWVKTGWDKEYTAIFTDVIQASDWIDKIIRLVTRRCVVATWISEVKQNAI